MHERRERSKPRYPYAYTIGVRVVGSGECVALRTRDISEGGMFVVCSDPPELLTALDLRLSTPQGLPVTLPARVVRIVTPAMAQRSGLEPGVGVHFEQLDATRRVAVAAIVERARRADPRCRVPRRRPEAANRPPRDPMLAYLLTAIDGRRDPEQLAEHCMLELNVLVEMLDALFRDGQVAFHGAGETDRGGSPELGTIRDRARDEAARGHAAAAVELTSEQCQAIDELHARVASGGNDHYALLGIAPKASRKAVREAFFARARRFHPDAHHGKQLGAYRARLERVFDALSTAYSVLGTPARRQGYDRYLGQTQRVIEIEEQSAAVQSAAAQAPRPQPPRDPAAARAALGRSAVARLQRVLAQRAVEAPGAEVAKAEPSPQAAPARSPACESLRRGPERVPRRTLASQLLNEAEQGIQRGDRISAVHQLDLMTRLGCGEADWQPRHQDRYDRLAHELADTIEQIARYEERHQQWSKAARSWTRLCEVRTTDPECACQAAHALLQSGGDVREAVRLAERAAAAAPADYRNHEVLGKALLAAKLPTRAHRALTQAAQLRAQGAAMLGAQAVESARRPPQASVAR